MCTAASEEYKPNATVNNIMQVEMATPNCVADQHTGCFTLPSSVFNHLHKTDFKG